MSEEKEKPDLKNHNQKSKETTLLFSSNYKSFESTDEFQNESPKQQYVTVGNSNTTQENPNQKCYISSSGTLCMAEDMYPIFVEWYNFLKQNQSNLKQNFQFFGKIKAIPTNESNVDCSINSITSINSPSTSHHKTITLDSQRYPSFFSYDLKSKRNTSVSRKSSKVNQEKLKKKTKSNISYKDAQVETMEIEKITKSNEKNNQTTPNTSNKSTETEKKRPKLKQRSKSTEDKRNTSYYDLSRHLSAISSRSYTIRTAFSCKSTTDNVESLKTEEATIFKEKKSSLRSSKSLIEHKSSPKLKEMTPKSLKGSRSYIERFKQAESLKQKEEERFRMIQAVKEKLKKKSSEKGVNEKHKRKIDEKKKEKKIDGKHKEKKIEKKESKINEGKEIKRNEVSKEENKKANSNFSKTKRNLDLKKVNKKQNTPIYMIEVKDNVKNREVQSEGRESRKRREEKVDSSISQQSIGSIKKMGKIQSWAKSFKDRKERKKEEKKENQELERNKKDIKKDEIKRKQNEKLELKEFEKGKDLKILDDKNQRLEFFKEQRPKSKQEKRIQEVEVKKDKIEIKNKDNHQSKESVKVLKNVKCGQKNIENLEKENEKNLSTKHFKGRQEKLKELKIQKQKDKRKFLDTESEQSIKSLKKIGSFKHKIENATQVTNLSKEENESFKEKRNDVKTKIIKQIQNVENEIENLQIEKENSDIKHNKEKRESNKLKNKTEKNEISTKHFKGRQEKLKEQLQIKKQEEKRKIFDTESEQSIKSLKKIESFKHKTKRIQNATQIIDFLTEGKEIFKDEHNNVKNIKTNIEKRKENVENEIKNIQMEKENFNHHKEKKELNKPENKTETLKNNKEKNESIHFISPKKEQSAGDMKIISEVYRRKDKHSKKIKTQNVNETSDKKINSTFQKSIDSSSSTTDRKRSLLDINFNKLKNDHKKIGDSFQNTQEKSINKPNEKDDFNKNNNLNSNETKTKESNITNTKAVLKSNSSSPSQIITETVTKGSGEIAKLISLFSKASNVENITSEMIFKQIEKDWTYWEKLLLLDKLNEKVNKEESLLQKEMLKLFSNNQKSRNVVPIFYNTNVSNETDSEQHILSSLTSSRTIGIKDRMKIMKKNSVQGNIKPFKDDARANTSVYSFIKKFLMCVKVPNALEIKPNEESTLDSSPISDVSTLLSTETSIQTSEKSSTSKEEKNDSKVRLSSAFKMMKNKLGEIPKLMKSKGTTQLRKIKNNPLRREFWQKVYKTPSKVFQEPEKKLSLTEMIELYSRKNKNQSKVYSDTYLTPFQTTLEVYNVMEEIRHHQGRSGVIDPKEMYPNTHIYSDRLFLAYKRHMALRGGLRKVNPDESITPLVPMFDWTRRLKPRGVPPLHTRVGVRVKPDSSALKMSIPGKEACMTELEYLNDDSIDEGHLDLQRLEKILQCAAFEKHFIGVSPRELQLIKMITEDHGFLDMEEEHPLEADELLKLSATDLAAAEAVEEEEWQPKKKKRRRKLRVGPSDSDLSFISADSLHATDSDILARMQREWEQLPDFQPFPDVERITPCPIPMNEPLEYDSDLFIPRWGGKQDGLLQLDKIDRINCGCGNFKAALKAASTKEAIDQFKISYLKNRLESKPPKALSKTVRTIGTGTKRRRRRKVKKNGDSTEESTAKEELEVNVTHPLETAKDEEEIHHKNLIKLPFSEQREKIQEKHKERTLEKIESLERRKISHEEQRKRKLKGKNIKKCESAQCGDKRVTQFEEQIKKQNQEWLKKEEELKRKDGEKKRKRKPQSKVSVAVSGLLDKTLANKTAPRRKKKKPETNEIGVQKQPRLNKKGEETRVVSFKDNRRPKISFSTSKIQRKMTGLVQKKKSDDVEDTCCDKTKKTLKKDYKGNYCKYICDLDEQLAKKNEASNVQYVSVSSEFFPIERFRSKKVNENNKIYSSIGKTSIVNQVVSIPSYIRFFNPNGSKKEVQVSSKISLKSDVTSRTLSISREERILDEESDKKSKEFIKIQSSAIQFVSIPSNIRLFSSKGIKNSSSFSRKIKKGMKVVEESSGAFKNNNKMGFKNSSLINIEENKNLDISTSYHQMKKVKDEENKKTQASTIEFVSIPSNIRVFSSKSIKSSSSSSKVTKNSNSSSKETKSSTSSLKETKNSSSYRRKQQKKKNSRLQASFKDSSSISLGKSKNQEISGNDQQIKKFQDKESKRNQISTIQFVSIPSNIRVFSPKCIKSSCLSSNVTKTYSYSTKDSSSNRTKHQKEKNSGLEKNFKGSSLIDKEKNKNQGISISHQQMKKLKDEESKKNQASTIRLISIPSNIRAFSPKCIKSSSSSSKATKNSSTNKRKLQKNRNSRLETNFKGSSSISMEKRKNQGLSTSFQQMKKLQDRKSKKNQASINSIPPNIRKFSQKFIKSSSSSSKETKNSSSCRINLQKKKSSRLETNFKASSLISIEKYKNEEISTSYQEMKKLQRKESKKKEASIIQFVSIPSNIRKFSQNCIKSSSSSSRETKNSTSSSKETKNSSSYRRKLQKMKNVRLGANFKSSSSISIERNKNQEISTSYQQMKKLQDKESSQNQSSTIQFVSIPSNIRKFSQKCIKSSSSSSREVKNSSSSSTETKNSSSYRKRLQKKRGWRTFHTFKDTSLINIEENKNREVEISSQQEKKFQDEESKRNVASTIQFVSIPSNIRVFSPKCIKSTSSSSKAAKKSSSTSKGRQHSSLHRRGLQKKRSSRTVRTFRGSSLINIQENKNWEIEINTQQNKKLQDEKRKKNEASTIQFVSIPSNIRLFTSKRTKNSSSFGRIHKKGTQTLNRCSKTCIDFSLLRTEENKNEETETITQQEERQELKKKPSKHQTSKINFLSIHSNIRLFPAKGIYSSSTTESIKKEIIKVDKFVKASSSSLTNNEEKKIQEENRKKSIELKNEFINFLSNIHFFSRDGTKKSPSLHLLQKIKKEYISHKSSSECNVTSSTLSSTEKNKESKGSFLTNSEKKSEGENLRKDLKESMDTLKQSVINVFEENQMNKMEKSPTQITNIPSNNDFFKTNSLECCSSRQKSQNLSNSKSWISLSSESSKTNTDKSKDLSNEIQTIKINKTNRCIFSNQSIKNPKYSFSNEEKLSKTSSSNQTISSSFTSEENNKKTPFNQSYQVEYFHNRLNYYKKIRKSFQALKLLKREFIDASTQPIKRSTRKKPNLKKDQHVKKIIRIPQFQESSSSVVSEEFIYPNHNLAVDIVKDILSSILDKIPSHDVINQSSSSKNFSTNDDTTSSCSYSNYYKNDKDVFNVITQETKDTVLNQRKDAVNETIIDRKNANVSTSLVQVEKACSVLKEEKMKKSVDVETDPYEKPLYIFISEELKDVRDMLEYQFDQVDVEDVKRMINCQENKQEIRKINKSGSNKEISSSLFHVYSAVNIKSYKHEMIEKENQSDFNDLLVEKVNDEKDMELKDIKQEENKNLNQENLNHDLVSYEQENFIKTEEIISNKKPTTSWWIDFSTNKSKTNGIKSKRNTNESKINTNKSKINTNKSKININKSKNNTIKLKTNINKSKTSINKSKTNINKSKVKTKEYLRKDFKESFINEKSEDDNSLKETKKIPNIKGYLSEKIKKINSSHFDIYNKLKTKLGNDKNKNSFNEEIVENIEEEEIVLINKETITCDFLEDGSKSKSTHKHHFERCDALKDSSNQTTPIEKRKINKDLKVSKCHHQKSDDKKSVDKRLIKNNNKNTNNISHLELNELKELMLEDQQSKLELKKSSRNLFESQINSQKVNVNCKITENKNPKLEVKKSSRNLLESQFNEMKGIPDKNLMKSINLPKVINYEIIDKRTSPFRAYSTSEIKSNSNDDVSFKETTKLIDSKLQKPLKTFKKYSINDDKDFNVNNIKVKKESLTQTRNSKQNKSKIQVRKFGKNLLSNEVNTKDLDELISFKVENANQKLNETSPIYSCSGLEIKVKHDDRQKKINESPKMSKDIKIKNSHRIKKPSKIINKSQSKIQEQNKSRKSLKNNLLDTGFKEKGIKIAINKEITDTSLFQASSKLKIKAGSDEETSMKNAVFSKNSKDIPKTVNRIIDRSLKINKDSKTLKTLRTHKVKKPFVNEKSLSSNNKKDDVIVGRVEIKNIEEGTSPSRKADLSTQRLKCKKFKEIVLDDFDEIDVENLKELITEQENINRDINETGTSPFNGSSSLQIESKSQEDVSLKDAFSKASKDIPKSINRVIDRSLQINKDSMTLKALNTFKTQKVKKTFVAEKSLCKGNKKDYVIVGRVEGRNIEEGTSTSRKTEQSKQRLKCKKFTESLLEMYFDKNDVEDLTELIKDEEEQGFREEVRNEDITEAATSPFNVSILQIKTKSDEDLSLKEMSTFNRTMNETLKINKFSKSPTIERFKPKNVGKVNEARTSPFNICSTLQIESKSVEDTFSRKMSIFNPTMNELLTMKEFSKSQKTKPQIVGNINEAATSPFNISSTLQFESKSDEDISARKISTFNLTMNESSKMKKFSKFRKNQEIQNVKPQIVGNINEASTSPLNISSILQIESKSVEDISSRKISTFNPTMNESLNVRKFSKFPKIQEIQKITPQIVENINEAATSPFNISSTLQIESKSDQDISSKEISKLNRKMNETLETNKFSKPPTIERFKPKNVGNIKESATSPFNNSSTLQFASKSDEDISSKGISAFNPTINETPHTNKFSKSPTIQRFKPKNVGNINEAEASPFNTSSKLQIKSKSVEDVSSKRSVSSKRIFTFNPTMNESSKINKISKFPNIQKLNTQNTRNINEATTSPLNISSALENKLMCEDVSAKEISKKINESRRKNKFSKSINIQTTKHSKVKNERNQNAVFKSYSKNNKNLPVDNIKIKKVEEGTSMKHTRKKSASKLKKSHFVGMNVEDLTELINSQENINGQLTESATSPFIVRSALKIKPKCDENDSSIKSPRLKPSSRLSKDSTILKPQIICNIEVKNIEKEESNSKYKNQNQPKTELEFNSKKSKQINLTNTIQNKPQNKSTIIRKCPIEFIELFYKHKLLLKVLEDLQKTPSKDIRKDLVSCDNPHIQKDYNSSNLSSSKATFTSETINSLDETLKKSIQKSPIIN